MISYHHLASSKPRFWNHSNHINHLIYHRRMPPANQMWFQYHERICNFEIRASSDDSPSSNCGASAVSFSGTLGIRGLRFSHPYMRGWINRIPLTICFVPRLAKATRIGIIVSDETKHRTRNGTDALGVNDGHNCEFQWRRIPNLLASIQPYLSCSRPFQMKYQSNQSPHAN
jgi:hypothetical protein